VSCGISASNFALGSVIRFLSSRPGWQAAERARARLCRAAHYFSEGRNAVSGCPIVAKAQRFYHQSDQMPVGLDACQNIIRFID
jgi:hypothetical protein